MQEKVSLVEIRKIEKRILRIRGAKVILDADLAEFYNVPTKRLNEQVKRNKKRFPSDFMFQLNQVEKNELVAICDHLNKLKYSKALPYAFTEHGAIMAASVLSSPRAIEISIFIVRAFINLRHTIATHKDLNSTIDKIEHKLAEHDQQILALVRVMKKFLTPEPTTKGKRIGFHPNRD
jgi:hypothetical protein